MGGQKLNYVTILLLHHDDKPPHCPEIRKHTRAFHRCLTNRGHHTTTITPLFHRATQNALTYMSRTPDEHTIRQQTLKTRTDRTVFFHLQYHPQDPTARTLQHTWQQTVATPTNNAPLAQLKNIDGIRVPIQSLTIAYSHPPNLRNQFSIRSIKNRGCAVSSYLT